MYPSKMLIELVSTCLLATVALATSEPDPEPLAHFLANGSWAHPDIAPSYFSGIFGFGIWNNVFFISTEDAFSIEISIPPNPIPHIAFSATSISAGIYSGYVG